MIKFSKFVVTAVMAVMLITLLSCSSSSTKVLTYHYSKISDDSTNLTERNYYTWEYSQDQNPLQFEAFTKQIIDLTKTHNFYEVTDPNDAKYVFTIKFSIDDGKTETNSIPVFGQTGVSSSTTSGHINSYGDYSGRTTYTPSFGVVGSTTYEETTYSKKIELNVYERKDFLEHLNQSKSLYYSVATSQGTSSDINYIIPILLNAIFKDFPTSNQSQKIYEY